MLHLFLKKKRERIFIKPYGCFGAGESREQTARGEALHIDRGIVFCAAHFAEETPQIAKLFFLIPNQKFIYMRMTFQQFLVAFSQQEMNRAFRMLLLNFFCEGGRQNDVAQKSGLYD